MTRRRARVAAIAAVACLGILKTALGAITTRDCTAYDTILLNTDMSVRITAAPCIAIEIPSGDDIGFVTESAESITARWVGEPGADPVRDVIVFQFNPDLGAAASRLALTTSAGCSSYDSSNGREQPTDPTGSVDPTPTLQFADIPSVASASGSTVVPGEVTATDAFTPPATRPENSEGQRPYSDLCGVLRRGESSTGPVSGTLYVFWRRWSCSAGRTLVSSPWSFPAGTDQLGGVVQSGGFVTPCVDAQDPAVATIFADNNARPAAADDPAYVGTNGRAPGSCSAGDVQGSTWTPTAKQQLINLFDAPTAQQARDARTNLCNGVFQWPGANEPTNWFQEPRLNVVGHQCSPICIDAPGCPPPVNVSGLGAEIMNPESDSESPLHSSRQQREWPKNGTFERTVKSQDQVPVPREALSIDNGVQRCLPRSVIGSPEQAVAASRPAGSGGDGSPSSAYWCPLEREGVLPPLSLGAAGNDSIAGIGVTSATYNAQCIQARSSLPGQAGREVFLSKQCRDKLAVVPATAPGAGPRSIMCARLDSLYYRSGALSLCGFLPGGATASHPIVLSASDGQGVRQAPFNTFAQRRYYEAGRTCYFHVLSSVTSGERGGGTVANTEGEVVVTLDDTGLDVRESPVDFVAVLAGTNRTTARLLGNLTALDEGRGTFFKNDPDRGDIGMTVIFGAAPLSDNPNPTLSQFGRLVQLSGVVMSTQAGAQPSPSSSPLPSPVPTGSPSATPTPLPTTGGPTVDDKGEPEGVDPGLIGGVVAGVMVVFAAVAFGAYWAFSSGLQGGGGASQGIVGRQGSGSARISTRNPATFGMSRRSLVDVHEEWGGEVGGASGSLGAGGIGLGEGRGDGMGPRGGGMSGGMPAFDDGDASGGALAGIMDPSAAKKLRQSQRQLRVEMART